ncbi:MAG: hypothetical protein GX112_15955 [Clostridiaceae bacterium]|nr:hypothetical protein [Clostridiaceae bacterium]
MTEYVTWRRYQLLRDFPDVYRFLGAIYRRDTLNSYLLPPFFEYAHTHPAFNPMLTHRFGLWETDGQLVGVACYEMDIGACFLVTDCSHTFLLQDMLAYAERELSVCTGGHSSLSVWVTDREDDKRALLARRGYVVAQREAVRIFTYNKPFTERRCRTGFPFCPWRMKTTRSRSMPASGRALITGMCRTRTGHAGCTCRAALISAKI